MGVICRSETGEFMGASTLSISGVKDPAVMEALACREALALAEDLHLRRITVATDCLTVVKNMTTSYEGSYSMVLREIKATADTLTLASFRHENRASNSEAHRLARSATSGNVGRRVWLLEPPDGFCIPKNISVQ